MFTTEIERPLEALYADGVGHTPGQRDDLFAVAAWKIITARVAAPVVREAVWAAYDTVEGGSPIGDLTALINEVCYGDAAAFVAEVYAY